MPKLPVKVTVTCDTLAQYQLLRREFPDLVIKKRPTGDVVGSGPQKRWDIGTFYSVVNNMPRREASEHVSRLRKNDPIAYGAVIQDWNAFLLWYGSRKTTLKSDEKVREVLRRIYEARPKEYAEIVGEFQMLPAKTKAALLAALQKRVKAAS